ncbi:hypothetical protein E4U21_003163 [Claviceps maximensis]|nr:hypothetical protein E4U21_003163 [Claviceps maximensis]
MSDGIDKSLLDRLQALRGTASSSTRPQKPHAPSNNNPIKFNVIERARNPSGGDLLAARLQSLRAKAYDSPRPSQRTQAHTYDEDALLKTSDEVLEEMLAADMELSPPAPNRTMNKEEGEGEEEQRQGQGQGQKQEQKQTEEIKALLERLSASVPIDTRPDDDSSDSETTNSQASALIAQYKDEAELDRLDSSTPSPPPADAVPPRASEPIELPSAPETETTTSSTDMADLTARMLALRQPLDAPELLPSVPTSQPSKPTSSVRRLTSKTAYTDDDMDSWCTVCLEDATLRCEGCDGDVYCTRCWREMHLGPAAHFDDTSHRAVQFTRDRRRSEGTKIALGA